MLLSTKHSAMASDDAGKKRNSSASFDLDFSNEIKDGSDILSLISPSTIGRAQLSHMYCDRKWKLVRSLDPKETLTMRGLKPESMKNDWTSMRRLRAL
jgi:hypothetical protein